MAHASDREGGDPDARALEGLLLANRHRREFIAPVLLITVFALVIANGSFLSVAGGFDIRGIDAMLDQEFLDAIGAAVAQSQVVFFTAAIVAASCDREFQAAVLLKK